jgi:hypothetical protein
VPPDTAIPPAVAAVIAVSARNLNHGERGEIVNLSEIERDLTPDVREPAYCGRKQPCGRRRLLSSGVSA